MSTRIIRLLRHIAHPIAIPNSFSLDCPGNAPTPGPTGFVGSGLEDIKARVLGPYREPHGLRERLFDSPRTHARRP